jgi:hypothetical protein
MHQTLRFWDGSEWTDDMAPAPPKGERGLSTLAQVGVVAVGVVIGWFIIWVGAQAAPDTFYWPVKFVVEDLPSVLR